MTEQVSVAVQNASLDSGETTVGTAPVVQLRTGAPPANCAAADTGTLLCSMTLPSDWMSAAASGVKAKLGTWTGTGVAAGTPGHYRFKDSGLTTTHRQGTIKQPVVIATNALTAANGNVLNFAATTGVAVGDMVTGTGVAVNSKVLAFSGTTVTLDRATIAGVANAASITFGGDMTVDAASIAVSQPVTITSYQITDGRN
jgi:hypothetical protein